MWTIIGLGSVAGIYTLYQTGALKAVVQGVLDSLDDIFDTIADIDIGDIDIDFD